MKKITTASLLAGVLALATSLPVSVTPVTATFDGEVSGLALSNPQILNANPIGTDVSFNVTFDEHFATNDPWTSDITPAAGTLHIGSNTYQLDTVVSSLAGFSPAGDIFMLRFFGIGPITFDGGEFAGLYLRLLPDLTLVSAPEISFGYTSPWAISYSYAALSGDVGITPVDVPAPGTAFLMLPAVALLFRFRGKPSQQVMTSRPACA